MPPPKYRVPQKGPCKVGLHCSVFGIEHSPSRCGTLLTMFALVNFLLSTLIISWNFNETFTMNFTRKPINYSTKNIPLTSEKAYKKLLVEKIELLIKRMRWKTFFFDNPSNDEEPVQKYGFRSRSSPAQHKDLIKFEEDLLALAKNVIEI